MTSQPEPGTAAAVSRWTLPVLLLIVFVNQLGFGVVFPLQPFYAKVFEAPAWQITLMFAVFSLGQFLGELFWGRLSDNIGRRAVLLITIFCSAAGYLAFAYAPNIWIAIAVRGVAGVFAGNISAIQAYVVDVTPSDRLAHRIGLIGTAFGLGFVLGPSLGGLLTFPELGAAGFRPPLQLAAGLSGVAGLGVLLFVSEQRALARRIARDPGVIAGLAAALRDPVLRPLLLNTFVAFCAFSAMWSTAGLWGQGRFGWGPREVGIALALAGATGALAQGFLCGHVVRRLGETATIVVGLLFGGVFLLAEAFSPSTLFAVSAVAFASVGQAIAQPPVTSLISQSSSPEQQGSALGANTAAGALGRTAGPIVAGALFSLVGPTSPIFFAAAGMAPAAWLAVLAGRALRRRR